MIKHRIATRSHPAFQLPTSLLALGGLLLLGFGSVASPAPLRSVTVGFVRGPVQETKPLYYAKVKSDGVVVRNLMDAKGLELLKLSDADVVSVWGEEIAGWLEVEVPTGYAAYVFGRFLEPTQTKGVYRITRNAINIRPRPADDVKSFPLPQRLHAGDQVAVIGQHDPTKPMAEDWVRIWTPPGVRAFVRAENLTRLDDEKGEQAWRAAEAQLAVARAEIVAGAPRSGGDAWASVDAASDAGAMGTGNAEAGASGAGTQAAVSEAAAARIGEARAALTRLRRRVEIEQKKQTPDFRGAQAELRSIVAGWEAADSGLTVSDELRGEVLRELERVEALAEAADMFQELQRIKEQKDQETARLQKTIWEETRRLDPLGSAFDVHGVLVRRIGGDGTPHYTVEVRREVVAELLCTSGRYNLDVFSGYEVGVKGRTVVAEAAASRNSRGADGEFDLPVLDVARLAVLKRR